MSYTNKTLVQNYLKRELTEDEDALLVLLNPAIKKWIDGKTSSRFDKVDPSSRRYRGGEGWIDIDPCTDITAIELLDSYGVYSYTYTNETEYLAEPLNERVKREICRPSGYHFPTGTANIRVTARFSEWDGGVPEDIAMAATRIAGDMLKSQVSTTTGGAVSSEEIEGHKITYDTSQTTIEDAATKDPFVMSVLEQRRELLVG